MVQEDRSEVRSKREESNAVYMLAQYEIWSLPRRFQNTSPYSPCLGCPCCRPELLNIYIYIHKNIWVSEKVFLVKKMGSFLKEECRHRSLITSRSRENIVRPLSSSRLTPLCSASLATLSKRQALIFRTPVVLILWLSIAGHVRHNVSCRHGRRLLVRRDSLTSAHQRLRFAVFEWSMCQLP
jgi:hypothetical protein